jgi:hypothetical protein
MDDLEIFIQTLNLDNIDYTYTKPIVNKKQYQINYRNLNRTKYNIYQKEYQKKYQKKILKYKFSKLITLSIFIILIKNQI